MYFELDTMIRENDELTMLRNEIHKFAKEVIRPASVTLDQMNSKDTHKKDSPYFEVMKKMKKNGYHRLLVPEEYGGLNAGPEAFCIVVEELGWGSVGLATALGVDWIPTGMMSLIASPEIIEEILVPWMEDENDEYRGCWSVMDPDRGSDYIMTMSHPNPEILGTKGFCRAERDGDDWIIHGVKSLWTSSGPCANWALTHPLIPPYDDASCLGAAIIPLNTPGVSQSFPIDKLGTRDDPQGELVFDKVRIPDRYMLATAPELASTLFSSLISLTSTFIACVSVGLARAAFEEAVKYTKERVQGGKAVFDHQLTKYRLYKMFEKIETSRFYTRSVAKHVWEEVFENRTFNQSTSHALTAQAFCKEKAFEVVHDALQLFGGSGILKESLIEKLFRDARCLMIEDGTVEVLGLEAIEHAFKDEIITTD
ncbi:MAG: acyl-CoA dehydrogenase family protein [Bacillota bacterium]